MYRKRSIPWLFVAAGILAAGGPASGQEAGVDDEAEQYYEMYEYEDEKEGEDDVYRTVVKGKKEEEIEEVPTEKLTKDEILKIPGTGGDLLKSIQNLPGTARAPAGSGFLVIRGSAPGDSLVMLEGHPLPLIYHFGTFSSVINTELIDEIEFIPGNFPVRYGRATGGLINVTTKLDIPEKWTGSLDIDIIDAGIFFKGKVTDKAMIAGSVRRSYIDAFLEFAVPEDMGVGIIAAPVYYDYQLMSLAKPTERDELKFIIAGDDDRVRLLFQEASEGDPGFGGAIGANLSFHVFQAHWKHVFKKGILYHASIQTGYEGMGGDIGPLVSFKFDNFILSHFQVLKIPIGDSVELKLGVDTDTRFFRAKAFAPALGPAVETFAGADLAEIDKSQWVSSEAVFLEARLNPVKRITITGGIRLDYLGLVKDFELHPRLMTRLDVDDKTALTAGVGVYTLEPSFPQIIGDWGNPALLAERAIHYGVGVERHFPRAWIQTTLQFFWKSFDRLVIPSEAYVRDEEGEWVPELYNNKGRGRSYGLELLVKIDPGHRIRGWLAYTLSKAERWEEGLPPYPFNFDQPHVLTLVLQGDLGRGWELGIRFRLASGNPFDRIVDSVYNADYDVYLPVTEPRPTGRLPVFHQLDVRLDKKFTFRYWWFAFYVDIWNVYYAKNPEGLTYNYDYSQKGYVYGLPVLPTLGIQGGF
jgi:outer membrane receptor protein involved in Fe transport